MSHKISKFDGDTLLSNGLFYLILAGYIATVYTVVFTIILAAGIASTKDPFSPPWWVNIIVITIVALTFRPVRRWLQSRINVLIYGQHDDPYALISQVNQQLQIMTSPQRTLLSVAETIGQMLKLPYLAIETQHNSAPLTVEFGRQPNGTELKVVPLLYLGQPLGKIQVAARRVNDPLSEDDLMLLRDVAQSIGIALHAAQLTADLQASRERLVIAREEERRRIRNDLHDGMAPTLSSLQLQIGAMRTLIRQNPDKAEAIANDLRDDLRYATAEIRRLVYELRPPMLDELGLVGALRSLNVPDSEVCFEVNASEPMPKLPAAVEVAVYRIASEAIQNVVTHAQATSCVIRIEVDDKNLVLSVADNGKGLPPEGSYTPGVGLRSMKERAAELGGRVMVGPGEKGGVRVVAQFPIEVQDND